MTLRRGDHIRVTLFLDKASPRLRNALESSEALTGNIMDVVIAFALIVCLLAACRVYCMIGLVLAQITPSGEDVMTG